MTVAARSGPRAVGAADRRKARTSRRFGRGGSAWVPQPPDLRHPIEDQIDQFRGWVRHGCPIRQEPTPLLAELVEACTNSNSARLDALAKHDCAWVRLGVACNKHTRRWTLWGDGVMTFGLTDDDEPWVAASVLLRTGRPPREIVSAVRAAALSPKPAV